MTPQTFSPEHFKTTVDFHSEHLNTLENTVSPPRTGRLCYILERLAFAALGFEGSAEMVLKTFDSNCNCIKFIFNR